MPDIEADLARYTEGVQLMKERRFSEAEPLLTRVVEETFDFLRREHSRMLLGYARSELQDWKGAIECFHQAMVNDIDCLPAYTALGHAYLMGGQGEKAVETFRIAVQRDPKNVQARHGLGWALLETNTDLDEALYQAQEALHLDSESAAVRDTVGWALYKHGDLEAAAEQMEEAVRLDPDHPVILGHRREILDELRRKGRKKAEI